MQLVRRTGDNDFCMARCAAKHSHQTEKLASNKLCGEMFGCNINLSMMPALANLDHCRLNKLEQHLLKWIERKRLCNDLFCLSHIKADQRQCQRINQAMHIAWLSRR